MIRKFQYPLLVLLIVSGFVVRLYKIHNPIADWHSWRQADTSAVTRNFIKYGVHPLLPRYDDMTAVSDAGFNLQTYRLVEFPLFNLVHYLFYRLGSSISSFSLEFWGRMVSVLASLVSAICIYFLVKRHVSVSAGLASMAVFLFMPFNIYFSRVVLPDPMMTALALASLLAFDLAKKWIAYFLGMLAVLVKPTAIFLLLPLLFSWRWATVIMVAPFIVWRMWQQLHPQGIPGSGWLLNGDHIRFKGAFFRWIFADRLGRQILGYWGLWPALNGLLELPKSLLWLVGGSVLYLFVFATGNVRHDYYQIPIIPAVAIMTGVGLAVLWRAGNSFWRTWFKRGVVAVSVAFMFAFGWFEIRGNYQINNPGILAAGLAADRLLPADAVVIADYNGDTAFLYQTNRHGFPNVPLPIPEMISRMGVQYYISVNYDNQTNQLLQQFQTVEKTPQYAIIDLQHPL